MAPGETRIVEAEGPPVKRRSHRILDDIRRTSVFQDEVARAELRGEAPPGPREEESDAEVREVGYSEGPRFLVSMMNDMVGVSCV